MTGPATAGELGGRACAGDRLALARLLSLLERGEPDAVETAFALPVPDAAHVVGFTGPPGAGKSTLIDAVTAAVRGTGAQVAVLAVDPSSPFTGGALLGDRIRMMRHTGDPGVFIRSLANRGHPGGLSAALPSAVRAVTAAGFDTVLVETVGVGQAEVDVAGQVDTTIVVATPGTGDAVQTGKAGVLEIADLLVVNKADRTGAKEAVRDLRDMVRMKPTPVGGWRVPVLLTRADNAEGVDELLGELRRHRDHLAEGGALQQGRTDRLHAVVLAYAIARVRGRLDLAASGDAGRQLLESVTAGCLSPLAAAEQLVELTGSGPA